MTRQVYIEINGTRFDISDGAPFEIIDIDNLGASTARRITERSPAQDGDTDIDVRLEARTIAIVMQAIPSDAIPYETIRALINRYFRATTTKIVLGIEFDNGVTRYIDTQSLGNIALPLNIEATNYLRFGVNLRAANPTFYDPAQQSLSFAIQGGGNAFTIPSFVPTFFGVNTLDQITTIDYAGTYKEFPVIQVYGPITDLVIINQLTGAKIDFTGHTVANGDYWTIDLRFGRKQVYRNGNTSDSQLYRLSTDSNIAEFAIVATAGQNITTNPIRVTGSGLSAVSQVYFQYYNRFDGI